MPDETRKNEPYELKLKYSDVLKRTILEDTQLSLTEPNFLSRVFTSLSLST